MHIQSYTGTAAHPFLPDLARLRISVFRDVPYLYDDIFNKRTCAGRVT